MEWINGLFTMNIIWWEWEKKYNKTKKIRNQGKIPRLVALPFPRLQGRLEADCFPVSENTENKPDLP